MLVRHFLDRLIREETEAREFEAVPEDRYLKKTFPVSERKYPKGRLLPMTEKDSIQEIIDLYKKDLDLSLIRESLKLTPTERIRRLEELQLVAEEMKRAGKAWLDSQNQA
ncbi:hypothetical protein ACE5IS_15485 [Leptospira wolffii]|uniref:Uncharacterized protein n=1 Tax=Leptospira wolffii TaxID=409998 RepID=A0ABV5BS09_9LEPT|nr:hypothetical protein [Leptospira wolffii]EPG66873.1 hypothetical protein LEP1GSC061_1240 [Leptospira wolffii serovar Khorat str. Khorat-H2]